MQQEFCYFFAICCSLEFQFKGSKLERGRRQTTVLANKLRALLFLNYSTYTNFESACWPMKRLFSKPGIFNTMFRCISNNDFGIHDQVRRNAVVGISPNYITIHSNLFTGQASCTTTTDTIGDLLAAYMWCL
jgi:hypothetical protein